MDSWEDLFERAGAYETSVESIRETLTAHREAGERDAEGDDG
jgi:hypothetical protein